MKFEPSPIYPTGASREIELEGEAVFLKLRIWQPGRYRIVRLGAGEALPFPAAPGTDRTGLSAPAGPVCRPERPPPAARGGPLAVSRLPAFRGR